MSGGDRFTFEFPFGDAAVCGVVTEGEADVCGVVAEGSVGEGLAAGEALDGLVAVPPTVGEMGTTPGNAATDLPVLDRPGWAHAASAENAPVAITDPTTSTRVAIDTFLSPASRGIDRTRAGGAAGVLFHVRQHRRVH